jgi:hypothetical protein
LINEDLRLKIYCIALLYLFYEFQQRHGLKPSMKLQNEMSALSRTFLLFVGWAEPTPCIVGFRCTQPNPHLAGDMLKGETQQRLTTGATPEVPFLI